MGVAVVGWVEALCEKGQSALLDSHSPLAWSGHGSLASKPSGLNIVDAASVSAALSEWAAEEG